MVLRPDVSCAITAFSPRLVDERAAAFAQEVVARAAPTSVARARALLFATSRLAAFSISLGLEPSAEVLLSPSLIERFSQKGLITMSGATRRTVRTNLRFVAARVLPPGAAPAPLSRERSKAPYSRAEIASLLALCDAQPTETRRNHASALVCLGAGAGLTGADLRAVRGTDIVRRCGGLLVVCTARSRVVPVRAEFHERLECAASYARGDYAIGGTEPNRRNVTYPLVSSLAGGLGLARLDTGRLRATWLVACAEAIGLKAFMDAAGITCSQRLGDLVAHLDPVGEERAVALLGARR